MLKQLATTAITALSLLTTNAYAMHINLKHSPDITNKIYFNYEIYNIRSGISHIKHQSMSVDIPINKLSEEMNKINDALSYVVPMDNYQGDNSLVTIGYINDAGTSISPKTCRNIPARAMMNITLNLQGCVVN